MPKKRTYGYLHDPDQEYHEEEPNQPEKTPKRRPPRPDHTLGRHRYWPIRLFLLPVKVIFFGLRLFWGLLLPKPRRREGRLRRRPDRNWGGKLSTAFLTLFVFGLLFGIFTVIWVGRDLPDPNRLTDRQVAQSTKIYDRTGTRLLYEIFTDQKRTIVELADIPDYVKQGVIATEDTEFFIHKGVRPLSILRSIFYGVLGRGSVGGGASTLTQQLVKNAILTNEKTITRKLKEIILSIRLEQKYTKEEILKIYFNEIPYGSTNYGVEAAAESYFGKKITELNLQESATLAGLPKSPSRYLRDPHALKNRRDFVLERMAAEGYITKAAAAAAAAEPVTLQFERLNNIEAPHFVLYVKKLLEDKYGEHLVNSGGLKVITTLDWRKQQIAEMAVSSTASVFAEAKANNAALVSLDPKTGQILALVGSRNFFDNSINGQFDVATIGKRQPGSSFKSIIYAAAFSKGYTPDTLLFDVDTNFSTTDKEYRPVNYDGKEHGVITMRTALQGSLNIPAVQTLYLVGSDAGVKFAELMGYTTLSQGDFGLTLVLGGGEVKLLEHTAAYGVFANNGVKQPTTAILRVEDAQGNALEEWKPSSGEKIIDDKITATISNILSDDAARAFIFGAGGILTLPDRPVAAKSGTTNNYIDAWTMGYTPSLVAGVWAGNTDNTPLKPGFGGSKVAGVIWNKYMQGALKGTPVEQFPDLPPNDATKPILRGQAGGSIHLLINRVTGNIAASSTPPELIEERNYVPPHSILHYVNKDDPRGPVPDHPENDSQYSIWENAIQDWLARERKNNPSWNIQFDEPPTIIDDPQALEFVPAITVLSPAPSSTIISRQIDTNIQVLAKRGIKQVNYRLDGRFLETVAAPPFNLHAFAADLLDGPHTLTIVAEDNGGSRAQIVINFTLQAGEPEPHVSWGVSDFSLGQNDFPRSLFLNPFKTEHLKTITLFQNKNGVAPTTIGTITDFSHLFNNQITYSWAYPGETGVWILSGEVETKDGRRSEIGGLRIEIK